MSKEEADSALTGPDETALTLAELRQDYRRSTLAKSDVADCPFDQFETWFQEARVAEVPEPNAMVLATVGEEKMPSARTVLLKGLENGAFVFFTSYDSRKGREIAQNPRAAATFLWKELERQVCIRGTLEKSSRSDSEAYFHSRPYGSQIGAHASTQSEFISNRKWLESRYLELSRKYPKGGAPIPLPQNWGGFRLLPISIEFWQGRPSRLHDRILYSLRENGSWESKRLSP